MARTTRPVKAKRKTIRVYKGEQRGDIHISGGVAKIRLTPKVILLFLLMVCGAVGILIVAVQHGREQIIPGAPRSLVRENVPATALTTTQPQEDTGPVISSIQLSPQAPTAARSIELKYMMANPSAGDISYSVRWYVDGNSVQDGPSTELQPGMFRKGSQVYAELTASDSTGRSVTLTSSPVTALNTPPQLSGVTIEPKQAVRGGELTATAIATDADNDPVSCLYQWMVNGAPSGPAGAQNTFSTANLGKQDVVTVSSTCSDGSESTQPSVSNPVSFGGNSEPQIVSSAPDSIQGGVYTYQVAARDPDGDKLQYRLERGPAGMTIDGTSGLIQWAVPKGVMYTGRNEIQVKFTVEDGNGGAASQEYVIVLVDYVNY